MSISRQTSFAADVAQTSGSTKSASRGLSFFHSGPLPSTIKYLEDYDEKDFLLPDEELPDYRLTYHEQQLFKKQKYRIKKAGQVVVESTKSGKQVENLFQSSILSQHAEKNERLYRNGMSTNTLGRVSKIKEANLRIKDECKAELNFIKSVVGKDQSKLLSVSKMTPSDYGDESTLDYPKLGSLEEAIEDLRLEALEGYYKSHGAQAAVKWSCEDRRMLRNWFKALDYDSSGEVSVPELQDPLLSAGVLKTRDQVFRVLLNADKNDTMGLDFKEFLDALHGNSLANVNQLMQLQSMGSDSSGQMMDTMITAERRKKLINSIVDQNEKRQYHFDKSFNTMLQTPSGAPGYKAASRKLKKVENQHEYERLLHNKYVESLQVVVESKKAMQLAEDDRRISLRRTLRSNQSSDLSTLIPGKNNNGSSGVANGTGSALPPKDGTTGSIENTFNPYYCFNGKVSKWNKHLSKNNNPEVVHKGLSSESRGDFFGGY